MSGLDKKKNNGFPATVKDSYLKRLSLNYYPPPQSERSFFFSLLSDGQANKKEKKLIQNENTVLLRNFFFLFHLLKVCFKLSNSKKNFFFLVGSLAQHYNLSFNLFTWHCILVKFRDGIYFDWVGLNPRDILNLISYLMFIMNQVSIVLRSRIGGV